MAASCTNMEIISCERYEIGAIGESMALFFLQCTRKLCLEIVGYFFSADILERV